MGDSADGSALCLSCGLCCNGALHPAVNVRPEDVEDVSALRLTVKEMDGHFTFRQPCPLYQDDRCAAYPNHPTSCKSYRCDLLQRLEAGQIAFADAMAIVSQARALYRSGGDAAADGEAWKKLRVQLRQPDQMDPTAAMRVVALNVVLKKHFDHTRT